jgi:hypothetical protein
MLQLQPQIGQGALHQDAAAATPSSSSGAPLTPQMAQHPVEDVSILQMVNWAVDQSMKHLMLHAYTGNSAHALLRRILKLSQ